MHSHIKMVAGAIAITTALALAGCSTAATDEPTGAAGAAQEIHIGAPVTVSGDAAFVGLSASAAFTVAQTIINADPETYLGSADRSLVISTKDAGATAAQAIAISRDFLGDAATLAIVGPSTTPQATALAPFAQESSIPLVIPSSPAAGLSEAGKYVFQIAMSNDVLAASVVNAVVTDSDFKKVGVIYSPDNPADLLAGTTAIDALKKLDVEAVSFEIPFAEPDYSAAISKMNDAGVDGIFIATQSGGVASAMVAADRVGLKPQWMGGPMLTSGTVLTNAGAVAEGAIASTDYNPELDSDLNTEFRKQVEAESGAPADVYAAQSFSAILAIAAAIKSIPADEQVTRDSLAEALAGVSDAAVVVGTGTLGFTDTRSSKVEAALLQLDGTTWSSFK